MDISSQILDMKSLTPNSLENISVKEVKTDDALRSVANDFESFFMNQILEASLKSSSIAGEGSGSDIIKGMYTDALSQESAGSLGISDMLYKFLSEKKT
jgi:Rod binding domain-containing protein